MELILTCKECGHQEQGFISRALMVKIRMHNHLEKAHPFVAMAESFADTINERQVESATLYG